LAIAQVVQKGDPALKPPGIWRMSVKLFEQNNRLPLRAPLSKLARFDINFETVLGLAPTASTCFARTKGQSWAAELVRLLKSRDLLA
jgi:hypothetical protein